MTRCLILIRHAKSGWDDPFADDHDRTLTQRGIASADAIGRWLAGRGHCPDHVLCSTAARTVQTLEQILPHLLPARPGIDYLGGLYHAAASDIAAIITGAKGATVAVIGHNPGIGDLACGLVKERPDHPRFPVYPTAATTVIDFAIDDWAQLRPCSGTVIDFVVPRDLLGSDFAE